ncbi:MAG TPA: hypothetical protein VN031_02005 [Candidatus Microsaccharimonas sp.]|nr:hypothetical protein [Candidatus Microsaccharimonas sp.]
MKKLSQSGFTIVETLLVLILLAILGFTGFYVYNAQHDASKSLDAASKTVNSASTAQSQKKADSTSSQSNVKYLDIKEWGVKFPYTSTDTLSYVLHTDAPTKFAAIVSANEATNFPGCSTWGAGSIDRGFATDGYYDTTIADEYRQNPGAFTKLGDYYYYYGHDQAACAQNPTAAAAEAQGSASDLVKAIVPKVQAD